MSRFPGFSSSSQPQRTLRFGLVWLLLWGVTAWVGAASPVSGTSGAPGLVDQFEQLALSPSDTLRVRTLVRQDDGVANERDKTDRDSYEAGLVTSITPKLSLYDPSATLLPVIVSSESPARFILPLYRAPPFIA